MSARHRRDISPVTVFFTLAGISLVVWLVWLGVEP